MISDERLDEMINGMKLFADVPCGGIKINEFSSNDLYESLKELKERRESELRPYDKFFGATLLEQLSAIKREVAELEYEVVRYEYPRCTNKEKVKKQIVEEAIDVMVAC